MENEGIRKSVSLFSLFSSEGPGGGRDGGGQSYVEPISQGYILPPQVGLVAAALSAKTRNRKMENRKSRAPGGAFCPPTEEKK